ncbi:Rho GTPase [Pelomyxa schiedti]|nr:Rho GTPase [Pelomyxa schiedti]
MQVKCVVVGSGAVGKTDMVKCYMTKIPPTPCYSPTVYHETYCVNVTVDGHPVCLDLVDTSGCEDYDRLRPLLHKNTDIFIIAFSVISPASLGDVSNKWVPEITRHCPHTPFVLAGTKFDLREDPVIRERLTPVTFQQGIAKAKEIKAVTYLECSTHTQQSVIKVFEEAVKCAILLCDSVEYTSKLSASTSTNSETGRLTC